MQNSGLDNPAESTGIGRKGVEIPVICKCLFEITAAFCLFEGRGGFLRKNKNFFEKGIDFMAMVRYNV